MSTTIAPPKTSTAVGVIRVSRTKGREGETFHSPEVQHERIEEVCGRYGLRLVGEPLREMNVSGGADLADRTGLLPAVKMVERGEADVIVVAYFDRLVRSVEVQAEVLRRVEAAGGKVIAADLGELHGGKRADPGQWLNGQTHGMMAEYMKRVIGQKSHEAQVRAVRQGRPPIMLPPGLHRVGDRVEIDPKVAPVVVAAFEMRARGQTIASVREHLRSNGIDRSYHGVSSLLASRLLAGDIVFGDLRGEVPAVIERGLWERVQRVKVTRGRKAKSVRLLARLGILRCGSCGSRMVVGSVRNGAYWMYRCPPTGDCQKRVTISATIAEEVVTRAVREGLDGTVGLRGAQNVIREARTALEAAQEALDATLTAFAGAGADTEPAAIGRLAELRHERDEARERVERLGLPDDQVIVLLDEEFDTLSPEDQRRCIRATLDRVDVHPAMPGGKPADRLEIVYHDGIARLTGKTPPLPSDLEAGP
ncbi:MAG: recombinase family protein [Solirubrobacteraceae bacterium]